MPLSNYEHIPLVLHFATAIRPLRVLDVGVGMGAYGFLLRQYLDIAHGRLTSRDWKVLIDGIEIYEPYSNPVWQYAYDRISIADALTHCATIDPYDLILCNDILEHFELDEAEQFLKNILSKCRVMIATTPSAEYAQGPWLGNEAETHRSLLTDHHFPHLVVKKTTQITTCYVCARDLKDKQAIRNADHYCPELHYRYNDSDNSVLSRTWRIAKRLFGSSTQ